MSFYGTLRNTAFDDVFLIEPQRHTGNKYALCDRPLRLDRDCGFSMVSCLRRLRFFSQSTRTTGTRLTRFHFASKLLHLNVIVPLEAPTGLRCKHIQHTMNKDYWGILISTSCESKIDTSVSGLRCAVVLPRSSRTPHFWRDPLKRLRR